MQTRFTRQTSEGRRAGFTIPELLIAAVVSVGISGSVIFLLLQAAIEQKRGLANTTVEQSAYLLQSSISTCLRCMSANQGLSPNYTTGLYDEGGHLLGYQTVFFFSPNPDGSYTTEKISVDATSGRVTYTPDITSPGKTILWMTNNATVALRQLYFNTSFNPDGSLNASLVSVSFVMDGNSATPQKWQNTTSICRTFAVRMRSES